jgi:hypothetical protein
MLSAVVPSVSSVPLVVLGDSGIVLRPYRSSRNGYRPRCRLSATAHPKVSARNSALHLTIYGSPSRITKSAPGSGANPVGQRGARLSERQPAGPLPRVVVFSPSKIADPRSPRAALCARTLLVLRGAEAVCGCLLLTHISAVLRGAVVLVSGEVIDF